MKHDEFTIIVDTREQLPWEFGNHTTSRTKLDTGDYSIEGLEHLLAIERKQSVSEIANNITEKRFQDVIHRLSKVKYSFLLLEFDLEDILIYPVGSTVPKKMWGKLRVTPKFLLKHLIELQILHNIKVVFCGDGSNAETMALSLMRKIYAYHGQPEKDI